ncbi:hypothetical protein JMJ56_25430 [Belnapia sp. T18]|uniref:Uncharacterized protein n=1 Tax=Belnapia arida TaxID=2804533 RepID=A0ABS1U9H8_9PROT|nr:hypothetical protein [Belnapia arida]MBL6081342.1 hypothetical protein [Belnapia arida]
MGLMAIRHGEEPDPPREILGIAAPDAQVKMKIDSASEEVDQYFGRDVVAEEVTTALEAQMLGKNTTAEGICAVG